ncbi:MAG: hypothetical protein ACRCYQ_15255 [Nocardioides sp.]
MRGRSRSVARAVSVVAVAAMLCSWSVPGFAGGVPDGASGGAEDSGGSNYGNHADCLVVSTSRYLGLYCGRGRRDVVDVAEILRDDPVPTCWHEAMSDADLRVMDVVNTPETTWYWRRCVDGISKRPNRFAPRFTIGIEALGPGDTVVRLTPNQERLIESSSVLDAIPPPIAAISPMARPRVGARVSIYNANRSEVTVRAGSVLLRGRIGRLSVRPLGRSTMPNLTCSGTGYRADPGETPATHDGCWYKYQKSSAAEPDNVYRLWMTAHWVVDLSVDGGATWQRFNAFRKSQITTVPVTEIQTLVVN